MKKTVDQLIEEAVNNSKTEMEAKHTFRKMQWNRNRGTHMGHFESISDLWKRKGNA
tara:strand:+ start:1105 stop:1272 length:168 start_codon:yes stop_codon:yes gene_type:complete